MANFPDRLLELRKTLNLTQEEMGQRLGISSNYVSLLEGGKRQPSTNLVMTLSHLESAHSEGVTLQRVGGKVSKAAAAGSTFRSIPVVGWAHAGDAATYEELPKGWQREIPTECRDPNAFAVVLEGESMEPRYSAGDMLILQPGVEPFSGCLAVCRFKDDGIVFRRVEFLPDEVRLIALNSSYPTASYPRDSFSWIYPVWGRWTQVWR